jgi:hypothetical protein
LDGAARGASGLGDGSALGRVAAEGGIFSVEAASPADGGEVFTTCCRAIGPHGRSEKIT